MSVHIFARFLCLVGSFLLLSFQGSLYILNQAFGQVNDLPVEGLSFHSPNSAFHTAEVLNFDEVHLPLLDNAFSVMSKNSLPNLRSTRFSPAFFS